MTRLGGTILALIVLAVLGFGALLSFGPVSEPAPESTPVPQSVPRPAPPAALLVPVAGVARTALRDGWGDPRGGGARAHEGIDIAAPRGTPVVAVAPGRIEKLFDSAAGGTALYQRSADGRWRYYYAHLDGYAAGIAEGRAVRAGEPIGRVGDSGNAAPGDTHLHFGVERLRGGERWWQGEAVNPYPLLAARAATR